jgi:hypothetical protein
MPRDIRYLTGIASALLTFWLAADAALACACCSERAARYVAIEKLAASRLGEIERMDFAGDAFIAETAADPVIASQDFGSKLELAVTRTEKAMTFSFRDPQGRAAALTLAIPGVISIFEVDPRGDTKDEGLGPVLYKEWQLTANASGTGVFRPLVGAGQKLTLILHGRGRGCTEASHFTDWTLQVQGPSGNLALYGALTSSLR